MRLTRWSVALAAVFLGLYLPLCTMRSECARLHNGSAKRKTKSTGSAAESAEAAASLKPGSLKLPHGTYDVPPALLRRLLHEADSLLEEEVELLLQRTAALFILSDEAVYRRWLTSLKTFAQDEEARGHLGVSEEKLMEMVKEGDEGSSEF